MKKFSYKAKDQKGKTVSGIVEAGEAKQARSILRERGLVCFSLTPVRQDIIKEVFQRTFRRITLSDIATFTRQLSTMITAGLTINDALTILKAQSSPALSVVVDDVLRSVEGGSSLADALLKHPKVFNRVYVALVRAGETAGVLDEVLARLAENLEKQREFQGKVKGAMIYPVIIIVGMVVVAGIMMVFVIPKLLALYQEFQAKLPTPTKILIGISNFMVKFWWMMLVGVLVASYAIRAFGKTPMGRKKIDSLWLSLPILGNLQKQIIMTEMARTLGLLVGAGISIIDALNIVAEGVGNSIYEEELKEAAKQVEKGLPLAATLAVYEEFPPIVPQMISVGEETGKVDEVLTKLSRYFESESEQMVKSLTTAIEPLIMIVLGLGVGFLIIAVILPIYNLTTQF
ncbi:MAG: type II secretion system F family protein [Patescibacteria group bacterium]